MPRKAKGVQGVVSLPTLIEEKPQPTLTDAQRAPHKSPRRKTANRRKTKSTKPAKASPNLTEEIPQPTLTEEQAAPQEAVHNDRDAQGKFAAGNRGGPGNPHARHCARMLEVFRNAVSVEAFTKIVCKLIEKAEAGDTSAAKIIVSYVVGKPLPAPHPDSIDRDEWDHFLHDAVQPQEMKLVMSSLPTHVGNDFARVALPIMTEARTNDMAKQLLKGCPGARGEKAGARGEEHEGRGETVGPRGEENREISDPLSNGKMSDEPVDPSTAEQPSTVHHSPSTSPQFDPWDIDAAIAASTSHHEATEEDEMEHEMQEIETAPIANGKSKTTNRSTRHPAPATTSRGSDVRNRRQKNRGKKIGEKAKVLWPTIHDGPTIRQSNR
jgi:hypothetical protein